MIAFDRTQALFEKLGIIVICDEYIQQLKISLMGFEEVLCFTNLIYDRRGRTALLNNQISKHGPDT